MTDLDAYQQLVTSPGWLLLCDRVRTYWTAQLEPHLATAANETNDALALDKIRQVLAAKRAAESILALPHEEIRRLDTATPLANAAQTLADAYSRRGVL